MAGMAPTRILQVCSSLAWGGTEMHVPILSEKLLDRGHDVRLVLHPKGTVVREARERDIPAETIRIGGYFDPASTCALQRCIRRFLPRVIHLHLSRDLWQTVPAALLAKFDGPIVLTKHVGSYVTKRDPLHRWLYRRVSRVITVSETLNRNVRETCPIPPDRVVTVHPALDLARFDPARYDRKHTRRSLDIPADAILVGTVGRVSPGKGYEEFLQAARMLLDRHPDQPLRFVVVGSASYGEEAYHEEIVQYARELNLGETVLFTGFRRDIPALLNAMDVFIFPSRAEGFGATVIEAMAMGVACISTRSDGTLDTVSEGDTGLVFQGGDVEGLVRSVETLLTDEPMRERIAENGFRQVRARFNSRCHDRPRGSTLCHFNEPSRLIPVPTLHEPLFPNTVLCEALLVLHGRCHCLHGLLRADEQRHGLDSTPLFADAFRAGYRTDRTVRAARPVRAVQSVQAVRTTRPGGGFGEPAGTANRDDGTARNVERTHQRPDHPADQTGYPRTPLPDHPFHSPVQEHQQLPAGLPDGLRRERGHKRPQEPPLYSSASPFPVLFSQGAHGGTHIPRVLRRHEDQRDDLRRLRYADQGTHAGGRVSRDPADPELAVDADFPGAASLQRPRYYHGGQALAPEQHGLPGSHGRSDIGHSRRPCPACGWSRPSTWNPSRSASSNDRHNTISARCSA